jgi:alanine racemase
MLTSSDIAAITRGKLYGDPGVTVTDIVIDSRQVSFTEGLAFLAIKGLHHDGHLFIDGLLRKGIRVFVVSRIPANIEAPGSTSFIVVDDTVEALHLLAIWKRRKFRSTVIGITGSAGKTIVKEWLANVLGLSASVLRSPKSYNSQIGVPLSVWKLDEKYHMGIFEAGISMPGEMEKLREIIDPGIGIITNIGDAHSENFRDNREKASEKLKLFTSSSIIVYCRDQEIIRELVESHFREKKLAGWSYSDDASVFLVRKSASAGRTRLNISSAGKEYKFEIPFTDRASVDNAVTVAVTCLVIGVDTGIISKGLSSLVSVAMRMELRSGINNSILIEDYYNSDPGSLGMALEYLRSENRKHQNKRKTTLILSDFLQSGRDEAELYGEVASLLARTGIDKFIGIGESLSRNRKLFREGSKFFLTTDEFTRGFNRNEFSNEIILLKGARVYEFERIGELLEQQMHQTVLEINLDAIAHNLNEFRRCIEPGTRIMAMVKAFAYGAGSSEIAALLEYHRVSYLGVAYADEGIELRNAGVTLPVMVMNPDPAAMENMVRYNLEPEIYSFLSLERFVHVAEKHGFIQYPVHIKIDSGMHRLGFMPQEAEELARRISRTGAIKIVSVFSHLAASEDPEMDAFTEKQVKVYLEAVSKIESIAGHSFLRHILNSSGIVRFPQYQFDMVRPGIGIYGAVKLTGLTLKNAGRFRTRISQVKQVPANEPVGYSCMDVSATVRTIAIVPVGYADGLSRKMGNRNGELFISGKRSRRTAIP